MMDKNFTEYYFGNRKNFIKGLGVKQDKSLEAKQDEVILRSLYFSSENMKKSKDERKDYFKELYKTELEAIVDKKKENAKADENETNEANKESVDNMIERWEREYVRRNYDANKVKTIKTKIKELIKHYPNDKNSLKVELIHNLKKEFGWSIDEQSLEQLVAECQDELTNGR